MIREKFLASAQKIVPQIFRTMATVEMVYSPEMTEKVVHALSTLKYRLAYDITSLVSIHGSVSGYVALHVNRSMIQKATSSMIHQGVTEIDAWVRDAVGEVCEVIAGNMKADLHLEGVEFDIGLPLILSGSHVSASSKPPLSSTLCVFTTLYGNSCLELALDTV
jgi:chemotaxis protein CheX